MMEQVRKEPTIEHETRARKITQCVERIVQVLEI
jgi:hypothetical protein